LNLEPPHCEKDITTMCLAIPGQIQTITNAESLMRTGRVSFAGIIKDVNLAYVPEAEIGDYVMVHVGFAISTVDEDEAAKVFEYLDQMDELQELAIAQGEALGHRSSELNWEKFRPQKLEVKHGDNGVTEGTD
jgi:hydrogenase expression/formation protein HypC